MKIAFTVMGLPAPQGSMYARYSERLKRAFVVPDNKKTAPWRQDVAAVARRMADRSGDAWPTRGPVAVCITFHLPRPMGHFGKKGLRGGAPRYPEKKPDLSKLVRAVEDALAGIVYDDDARIVRHVVQKLYVDNGGPACADIEIETLVATVSELAGAAA